jgi:hypothetical protein
MTTELERLAERIHERGLKQAKWAMSDAPWHDERAMRSLMADAANCFTVAAALRSRSVRGEG